MTTASWEHISWEDTYILESTILRVNDNITLRVEEDLDNWHIWLIDKTDPLTNNRGPLRKGFTELIDAKRYAVEWAKENGHLAEDADILLE